MLGDVVRLSVMVAASPAQSFDEDQRVVLHAMAWQDFEALLAIRGDRSGVRMYYLDGEVEIVSPTKIHEGRTKTMARLLEAWALETDFALSGFGSWTLKNELREAGAEPDECYILGESDDADVPDLVIEVEWSRVTGLPKAEIYRRLGVRELWTIKRDGQLTVRSLEGGDWVDQAGSKLLPGLDMVWLASFLDIEPQSKAVRAMRDALRLQKRPG